MDELKTIKYQKKDLKKVKEQLKKGKIIAFPTDTVYGLGIIYNNKDALKRLKESKKRSETKPIPMMVKDYTQLSKVIEVNDTIKKLYDKFMPGALTIIAKRKNSIASFNSNNLDTIAIRIPNDEFVLSLLDEPMLVTSANISGEPALKNGEEVYQKLVGRIDGIVMGEANSKISSSIVDTTCSNKILREGSISKKAIEDCLKEKK